MIILQESILNKAKNFIVNNKGKLAAAAGLAALAGGGAYAASHYDMGNLFKHDDNQTPEEAKKSLIPELKPKPKPKPAPKPEPIHAKPGKSPLEKAMEAKPSEPKPAPKPAPKPEPIHAKPGKSPLEKAMEAMWTKKAMKDKLDELDRHHTNINADTGVPDQSESIDSGYNYKEPAKHEAPTISSTFNKVEHGLGKSFDTLYSKAKQALTPDIATLKPVKPEDNPDAGEGVPDVAPASKSVFAAPEKPATPVMGNRYKVPTWNERMRIQNIQNGADYDMNDW